MALLEVTDLRVEFPTRGGTLVAVDGISLTIAAVEGSMFSVAIIPTTLNVTTLSGLGSGACVNIESDIMVRTIVHHLEAMQRAGGLTMETLSRAGFTS